MTGRLFVWGAGAAGRLAKESNNSTSDRSGGGEEREESDGGEGVGIRDSDGSWLFWCPPDGALLIDVSCGMHMTMVVDDRGRIWSLGDNKVTPRPYDKQTLLQTDPPTDRLLRRPTLLPSYAYILIFILGHSISFSLFFASFMID